MNITPLVSVIITAYNRPNYLKETLDSIVNQTYSKIEVLVVDDGSSPENSTKIKHLTESFEKCIYYFKENTGQPDTRNYGIKKAKGTYIAFCDDDDYWVLDKLEKQVAILNNNQKYGVVTACIEYIDEGGKLTGNQKCHVGHNHGSIFKELLIKNRTSSIVPLIRKEIFEKVGLFNPKLTIGEDWDFWRRVSYYYKFYFLDETLAYVRLHATNMSASRSGKLLERFSLYRKLNKSLLQWGHKRFAREDIELIEWIEWCHYRRLLTNHKSGVISNIFFLIYLIRKKIISPFYLFKLVLKYNSKYELQK